MAVLWSFTCAAVILSLLQENNLSNGIPHREKVGQKQLTIFIGVREGILLEGRKTFALKLTICPKNRQLVLTLTS